MFVRGCKKFLPPLAYLFCLALPGSCLARFALLLADPCKSSNFKIARRVGVQAALQDKKRDLIFKQGAGRPGVTYEIQG